MKALGDGRIKFDIQDKKSQYTPQFTYYRDDGSRSSLTIQYRSVTFNDFTMNFTKHFSNRNLLSSNQDLSATNDGNTNIDTLWLEMTGISQISWGESATKDLRKCARAIAVGSMPEMTDEDLSGCAGEAQTIG